MSQKGSDTFEPDRTIYVHVTEEGDMDECCRKRLQARKRGIAPEIADDQALHVGEAKVVGVGVVFRG